MTDLKAIGIITSGGDCGGLNAVIKGAAQMILSCGMDPYIIPNGYAGLYNLLESGNLYKLDENKIEAISMLTAGSEAGNSRVKISKIPDPDKYKRIKAGLDKYGIGALIISGGDDSGSVVVDLYNNGIPCIHVPKTMDLDLHTYSVGGDSSVNRIARYIEDVKTTGRSHNRIMIVEVFGRYAGHTAFRGGLAADADCILIPEIPVDFDVVYSHMKKKFMDRIKASAYKAGTYVIVVSEGLTDHTGGNITDNSVSTDSFGHKKLGGTGKYVRDNLNERIKKDPEITAFMKEQGLFVENMNTAPEIRETVPGYLIRSGYTSAIDANFGRDTGAGAVILLENSISGVTVTGVVNGTVHYIPTADAIKQRFVDLNMTAFYEKAGVCFGREPVEYQASYENLDKAAWCYL
jgi:6-phosphofructokinase 1